MHICNALIWVHTVSLFTSWQAASRERVTFVSYTLYGTPCSLAPPHPILDGVTVPHAHPTSPIAVPCELSPSAGQTDERGTSCSAKPTRLIPAGSTTWIANAASSAACGSSTSTAVVEVGLDQAACCGGRSWRPSCSSTPGAGAASSRSDVGREDHFGPDVSPSSSRTGWSMSIDHRAGAGCTPRSRPPSSPSPPLANSSSVWAARNSTRYSPPRPGATRSPLPFLIELEKTRPAVRSEVMLQIECRPMTPLNLRMDHGGGDDTQA
jgi:hypothetical protein